MVKAMVLPRLLFQVETLLTPSYGTKATSASASDLAAGLHTITITDDKGCVTTASVTIAEPAVLSASADQDSPVVCNGESNGAATVTVLGGNAPYTYSWDKSASTSASANDLAAGLHTITITDDKGCVTTASVTIDEPAVLSASAVQDSPVVCNGESNGAATVTVLGGNAPYTYSWDKSASASASATDLAAGLHTITITDDKGCVTTASVTIAEPAVLS
ncbi:MAG: SprB repeat-containing protein [Draconibacterium sp.]|nr:SprB repeat-containing protein [Draconibacterium sp.]